MTFILVLLVFAAVVLFTWFVWIHSSTLAIGRQDVILILGYKTFENEPHALLEERLKTVLHLLGTQHYRNKSVIVSGGALGREESEAEIMKEYLVKRGIDPQRILTENQSKDTIENLQFSKEIMKKAEFNSCVIVSNSFHIRRIQIIAESLGIKATFYSKRTWTTAWEQWRPTLNEIKAFNTTLKLLKQVNLN